MPLSDTAIRNAKPQDKPYKLTDGGGLYLLVNPTGSHLWYWKYRHAGKEKKLAVGPYPAVSLAKAREARESARGLLVDGIDPSSHKRDVRREVALVAANTFSLLADEYLDKMRSEGKAPKTIEKAEWLLGLARPELGTRPMTEIRAPDVLAVLQRSKQRAITRAPCVCEEPSARSSAMPSPPRAPRTTRRRRCAARSSDRR